MDSGVPSVPCTPYVLYTNIYTLEGSEPKHNKYIDMYFLWLANIIKYANFQKNDICVTYMDEETYKYLDVIKTEKNTLFQTLKKQINRFVIIKYPPPSTHKEGMMQKYTVDIILEYTKAMHEQNPVYMYLDVDVLVVNNIRNLTLQIEDVHASNKTKFFLRNEFNPITHSDYFGDLMTDEDKQVLNDSKLQLPGFSAGIFGWQNNANIKELLNHVLVMAIKDDKKQYTIEQPYFNAALFHYLFYDPVKFTFLVMSREQISQNLIGAHLTSTNVLVNYCGEPGDQFVHWDKMYNQLLAQFLYTAKI